MVFLWALVARPDLVLWAIVSNRAMDASLGVIRKAHGWVHR